MSSRFRHLSEESASEEGQAHLHRRNHNPARPGEQQAEAEARAARGRRSALQELQQLSDFHANEPTSMPPVPSFHQAAEQAEEMDEDTFISVVSRKPRGRPEINDSSDDQGGSLASFLDKPSQIVYLPKEVKSQNRQRARQVSSFAPVHQQEMMASGPGSSSPIEPTADRFGTFEEPKMVIRGGARTIKRVRKEIEECVHVADQGTPTEQRRIQPREQLKSAKPAVKAEPVRSGFQKKEVKPRNYVQFNGPPDSPSSAETEKQQPENPKLIPDRPAFHSVNIANTAAASRHRTMPPAQTTLAATQEDYRQLSEDTFKSESLETQEEETDSVHDGNDQVQRPDAEMPSFKRVRSFRKTAARQSALLTTRRDAGFGGRVERKKTIKSSLDLPAATAQTQNSRFTSYSTLFQNMTMQSSFDTDGESVITIVLAAESGCILCLLKVDDEMLRVVIYDNNTNDIIQEIPIKGMYVRANLITQSDHGEQFAVAYNDNGIFHLLVFTIKEGVQLDFNINEHLGLDDHAVPISGLIQPICVCSFVSKQEIFYAFLHRTTKTHYHFVYDLHRRRISQAVQQFQLPKGTVKNFPQKCFYDPYDNHVHVFYRQGFQIEVEISDIRHYTLGQVSLFDIADIVIWKHQVLIIRSSQDLLFMKKIDHDEKQLEDWKLYHRIQSKGSISKNNHRTSHFQIVEDAMVYFYEFDEETSMPKLQNVMMNFMFCGNMIFSDDSKFCISYKQNQVDFLRYSRKMKHDFRVEVVSENFESAFGIGNTRDHFFIAAKTNGELILYDRIGYMEIGRIDLNLEKSNQREPIEILSIQKSNDGQLIGIFVGMNLIKDIEYILRLFVLKRDKKKHFVVIKQLDMQALGLSEVSKKFYFDNQNSEELILVSLDVIMKLNYTNGKMTDIYDFQNNLQSQPEFFTLNDEQTSCVIGTDSEGLLVNIAKGMEIDLDEYFQIEDLKNVIYDNGYFYIMANKRQSKLGYFLVMVSIDDPLKFVNSPQEFEDQFIVNWSNKLDIADVDMLVFEEDKKSFIVVTYKSIHINVYNVFVINIKTKFIVYRHESFQLWESSIMSFMNTQSKELISLSQDGLVVMQLSQKGIEKSLIDDQNDLHKLHSLSSCDYLKIDPQNLILYECSGENKIVNIQSQFKNKQGQTMFEKIYKLKISQMNIKELLLLQSIFHCESSSDILNLVQMQEDPQVFYKSYMELDRKNMVSILAFDSKSIQSLLSDKFEEHFQSEFPIFYTNKLSEKVVHGSKTIIKTKFNSAIDVAVENNQIRAVGIMIDHIVKYQDNFVSSFLFRNNLLTLISKGIEVENLLKSNVFFFQFEFDEWPQVHTNFDEKIVPFNGSIFEIRSSYNDVFPSMGNPLQESAEEDDDLNSDKFYKITYSLNLLPDIKEDTEEGESLIRTLEENGRDQLHMFEAKCVQDLIFFKWNKYAFYLHYSGAFMHCFYIVTITLYVHSTFLEGTYGEQTSILFAYLMVVGITYPLVYDGIQLIMQGKDYFKDAWNYTDILFQAAGIFNIIFKFTIYEQDDYRSVIAMSCVLFMALIKTMFFLRIFDDMSYLVSLISQVIYDLKSFLIFYIILIFMFSLILGVLGFQNFTKEENWEEMLEAKSYPGNEYAEIGMMLGNMITVLRMSIGDNNFSATTHLEHLRNYMFWFVWFVIFGITCVIFLNFIIAEACASYERVSENLNNFLLYQKTSLIHESEDMMWKSSKHKQNFPKYLISRKMEN